MLFLISDERTVERTENSMFPYLKEHPQDESGQAPARTHSAVVLFESCKALRLTILCFDTSSFGA